MCAILMCADRIGRRVRVPSRALVGSRMCGGDPAADTIGKMKSNS